MADVPLLRGPGGRPLRLAHLTTVGISQAKLLATELRVDLATGLDTVALSAPDEYVAEVEELGVRHVAAAGSDPRLGPAPGRGRGSPAGVRPCGRSTWTSCTRTTPRPACWAGCWAGPSGCPSW